MSAIYEGIQNALDPKLNAKVSIKSIKPVSCSGWSNNISLFNSFFITLEIYGHKDFGDIYWSLEPEPGPHRPFESKIEIYHAMRNMPVKITTRLDLQYNGYRKMIKDWGEFC